MEGVEGGPFTGGTGGGGGGGGGAVTQDTAPLFSCRLLGGGL